MLNKSQHGSWDGYLQSIHNDLNPYIIITEIKSGKDIKCFIKPYMLHELNTLIDSRIRIKGKIEYNNENNKIAYMISVYAIIPLFSKNVSLQYDSEFTGNLTTLEYLEKLREGDL